MKEKALDICPCGSSHEGEMRLAAAHRQKYNLPLPNDRRGIAIVAILTFVLPIVFVPMFLIRAMRGRERWRVVSLGIAWSYVIGFTLFLLPVILWSWWVYQR